MRDGGELKPSKRLAGTFLSYMAWFCLIYWTLTAATAIIAPATYYTDYVEYLQIAQGRMVDVHQPFAGRILAPEAARLLSFVAGLSAPLALALVSGAGWALAPILTATLLWLRKVPIGWALVVASLPYPALAARFYLVPDAWALCLVLSVFIAIERRGSAAAGLSAFALALARTSSILAIVLRLALDLGKWRVRLAVAIAAGFALGLVVKAPLIRGNQGNTHQMSGVLYILAKTPVNFMANLMGAHLYTNSFSYCPSPLFAYETGPLPGLGKIQTLGLCPFNAAPVVISLLCYGLIFGAIPLIALRRMARAGFTPRDRFDLDWRQTASFLAIFALSPAFGLTITRLFIEAYPLMLLAMRPLAGAVDLRPRQAIALSAYNLAGLILLAVAAPN